MRQETTLIPRWGFSAKQRIGLLGECLAVEKLTQAGYNCRLTRRWIDDFDILINGFLRCEVKLARHTLRKVRKGYYRPTWEFDLWRVKRDRLTLTPEIPLFILICEDDDENRYFFVCPNWLFMGRYRVNITSYPLRYGGYLADCLENWDNVAQIIRDHNIRINDNGQYHQLQ
jgi:hypothetical protein